MKLVTHCCLCVVFSIVAYGQQPVSIRVDGLQQIRPFKPSWTYFGYDEANYTYAENGKKLIQELVALSPSPVHIRTHFLLNSGDGVAELKWGSTNAYTEGASGQPVYDWKIVDRILDTIVEANAIPFVEIGFTPKALSSRPEPYVPVWNPHGRGEDYFLGWTYPPADYSKWSGLVYQWVVHAVARYGEAKVRTWNWEVWNEPDIGYWHGTPEEYNKLYDYTAAAVKRALPTARVGGPASTGPGNPKAAAFLRQFLEHSASGRNSVTGEIGAPLDFISFHAKGKPVVEEGHVRMGIAAELQDISRGFDIVNSFPSLRHSPIVLSEADPEGCAACSARFYPQNAYRNGTLYPSYEAAALKARLALESSKQTNLEGVLTWAFEFEKQPYFDGFRTLATNGVDKPILNFFRMTGKMSGGELVQAESSGGQTLDSITTNGVMKQSVDALAVRFIRKYCVMVWNYSDKELADESASVELKISGLPSDRRRVRLRHYRIDDHHSNAYTVWKQMGSPQHPDAHQYRQLEQAGQLEELEAARNIRVKSREANVSFTLPMHGVSLLEFSW